MGESAVKVQRPGIDNTVAQDIALIEGGGFGRSY